MVPSWLGVLSGISVLINMIIFFLKILFSAIQKKSPKFIDNILYTVGKRISQGPLKSVGTEWRFVAGS